MKRKWSFLLGLVLLAAPAALQAQYSYIVNADNSITITGYYGVDGPVTIPPTINGLLVTSIGDLAFFSRSGMTSVNIPGSVSSIGDNAFTQAGLTSVTIPGTVVNLGDEVFLDCVSLTNAVIANGVTRIGNGMFRACYYLTNVTIAGTVTTIGEDAFSYCDSLTNVTIPGSVTNIGDDAFSQAGLTSVYFMGDAPTADSSVFVDVFGGAPVVYYFPGTTGWNAFSANTGLTPVLWNPVIQTGGGSFGVRTNHFGFNVTGTANIPIVVEACTNLARPVWTPLQSLTLTNGLVYFSEPVQGNGGGRFYRIGSQ